MYHTHATGAQIESLHSVPVLSLRLGPLFHIPVTLQVYAGMTVSLPNAVLHSPNILSFSTWMDCDQA